jgi:hypothetical protein
VIERRAVKYYEEEVDGIVVGLEPLRGPLRRLLRSVVLVVTAFTVGDETVVLLEPPLRLVVRDKQTSHVLFRHGRYDGEDGIDAVREAARVIGTLGVDAYIRRERQW